MPRNLTIVMNGRLATLHRPPVELRERVQHLLSVPMLTPQRCRSFGMKLEQEQAIYCIFDQDEERLCFPAGLVPLVVEELAHAGHRVHVAARGRLPAPLRYDLSRLTDATPLELRLVCALDAQPGAVVEVRRPAQLERLVVMLLEGLPDARVLLAAPRRADADHWETLLRRRYRGQVGALPEDVHQPVPRRIGVGTHSVLRFGNPEDFDLVICLDAAAAAVPCHNEFFKGCGQHRICGLLAASLGSRRELLQVQATFGPLLPFDITARQRPAAVDVVWVKSAPLPRSNGNTSALAAKRFQVWHHRRRNTLLAEVARSLVTVTRPSGQGLADLPQWLLRHDQPKVAIVVAGPEHGRALLGMLPGWRLRQQGDDGSEESAEGSIMTHMAASALPVLACDVVIRADGEAGPLTIPGFPPPASLQRPRVLLVDLDDGGVGGTIASRRAAYTAHGWHEVNAPNPPQKPHRRRHRRGTG